MKQHIHFLYLAPEKMLPHRQNQQQMFCAAECIQQMQKILYMNGYINEKLITPKSFQTIFEEFTSEEK